MHSAGLELTKLTSTRLEDNLIRHRGDRTLEFVVGFIVMVLPWAILDYYQVFVPRMQIV